MDILLQSDGQLYPPRHAEQRVKKETPAPPPAPAPPPPPPAPCPAPEPPSGGNAWEELLILAVAILVLKSSDQPDLPLLLALAYVLFDRRFSLKELL